MGVGGARQLEFEAAKPRTMEGEGESKLASADVIEIRGDLEDDIHIDIYPETKSEAHVTQTREDDAPCATQPEPCESGSLAIKPQAGSAVKVVGCLPEVAEGSVRGEALHLSGVDNMSTEDVLEFFSPYSPSHIEWINDKSCESHVIFQT